MEVSWAKEIAGIGSLFTLGLNLTRSSAAKCWASAAEPPFPQNNIFLVLDLRGVIFLIKNGKRTKSPFLDITDRVHYPLFPGDEMGLLGLAFDPNFEKAQSRKFIIFL